MRIEAMDPGEAPVVDEWFDLQVAVRRVDLPDYPEVSRRSLVSGLIDTWPGHRAERWCAYDARGRMAGATELMLPVLDNVGNVLLTLAVHPDFRRQGTGRALFEHAVARTREMGRRRLIAESCEGIPHGPARSPAPTAFATAMGAERANEETHWRLLMSAVDDRALAGQLAAAWKRAAGYSLVQWGDAAPDDVVEDIAVLDSRVNADIPTGDLHVEPEKVDAARIRASERARLSRGLRQYNTAVRHDASGAIVALTTLVFREGDPYCGSQNITIALPEHRGHRLGTVVKLENLAYARAGEPQLRQIDTWNATTNTYMVAINQAMGFRPVDVMPVWQLDV